MPKRGDHGDRRVANGNISNPKPSKEKRVNQLMKWCFTLNNYTDDDILEIKNKLDIICEKYVFQREIGEERGTPHLQGAIWLKERARWSEFGLSNRIIWSKMRNEKASANYCQKSKTSVGEPIKGGRWPVPLKCIQDEQLYQWQRNVINLLNEEPDERSIYWHTDTRGGSGKSQLCRYLAIHKPDEVLIVQGGKLADLMNIIFNTNTDYMKMVIFDLPRATGNKISHSAIECLLNGMITNTKYETGTKIFNPPHVVVFSNEHPDLNMMSADRWKETVLSTNRNRDRLAAYFDEDDFN